MKIAQAIQIRSAFAVFSW